MPVGGTVWDKVAILRPAAPRRAINQRAACVINDRRRVPRQVLCRRRSYVRSMHHPSQPEVASRFLGRRGEGRGRGLISLPAGWHPSGSAAGLGGGSSVGCERLRDKYRTLQRDVVNLVRLCLCAYVPMCLCACVPCACACACVPVPVPVCA